MLEVDPRSAIPPYEQLRQQITALVRGGVLRPGTRLPAIRQLANDLGLAGGTVARAYRELESDGVVSTHGRHGTVVAAGSVAAGPQRQLLAAAARLARETTALGLTADDAVAALRAAFASGRNP